MFNHGWQGLIERNGVQMKVLVDGHVDLPVCLLMSAWHTSFDLWVLGASMVDEYTRNTLHEDVLFVCITNNLQDEH